MEDYKRSDAYGFYTPPEEQQWNDAKYKRLNKITSRPSEEYSTRGHDWHGASISEVSLGHGASPAAVGTIRWNNQTGHVGWLGVDEGHRHMVPKLLGAAKAHADEQGYAPPLYSNELSSYSYKLAKKYVPEHIPEHTTVEDMSQKQYEMGPADFHTATQHLNELHAKAIAGTPSTAHAELNELHGLGKRDIASAYQAHQSIKRGGGEVPKWDRQESLNNAAISGHLINETYKKHNGTDIPGYQASAQHLGTMYH